MIDVVELLGDRKVEAHSSIVLTYALDLLLYDGFLRRQMRNAGAANQMVFCDAKCYERELAAVASSRFLGRAYSVTPVHQTAAFHPKIYLLLGAAHGRLVIGSGNATLGGLTRNGELFGAFDFDASADRGPHPAFATVLAFVRTLAEKAPAPVRMQLDRATSRSRWLQEPPVADGRTLLIGGPGRPALLSQVLEVMGEPRIDSVMLCSASFDRRLAAIERLSDLPGHPSVTCLVQPDQVALDGEAVRRLGRSVHWRAISLAHLRRKADATDAFAHAKLYVFTAGDREFVAYGSANASAPALLGGKDPNTEVLVLLPPMKRGSVAEKLALGPSIESASVYTSLCGLSWPPDEDRHAGAVPLRLSGIAIDHGRLTATFATEPSARELQLALARSPDATAPNSVVRIGLRDDGQWTGSWAGDEDAARVGWIVDTHCRRTSNPVAVTWREVAECLAGSGMGRKYDDAIAAIQDGQFLSTALYALLDHVDDLPRSQARAAEEPAAVAATDAVSPRAQESFYSSRVAVDGHASAHLSTDRMDLDLLASLVKPLAVSTARDEEDWLPNEEEERRDLDAGAGPSKEGEPNDGRGELGTTVATIERLSRRMARRLDRAARAAEDALGTAAFELSTAALARQLWMTQIAAFLAGREVGTADGPAVCLAPEAFARYVVRLAHALAGGKAGGLLARAPASAWTGHDGENMKRGLAFAWTCVAWAAAYMRRHWETVAEPAEHPTSLAEAVPELVAARFVRLARALCKEPDESDLSRRMPAHATLTAAERKAAASRLEQLLSALAACDATPPQAFPSVPPKADPGTLVYSAGCGLTVVARSDGRGIQLVDLSRPLKSAASKARGKDRPDPPWLATFCARVTMPPASAKILTTYWRPPFELMDLWRRREAR